ncbi:hypothetical protein Dimus_019819 [Dionaea muscipula]
MYTCFPINGLRSSRNDDAVSKKQQLRQRGSLHISALGNLQKKQCDDDVDHHRDAARTPDAIFIPVLPLKRKIRAGQGRGGKPGRADVNPIQTFSFPPPLHINSIPIPRSPLRTGAANLPLLLLPPSAATRRR